MTNDPFPGPGLSLAQALERTTDIDVWCAGEKVKERLAAAGGPITPEQFPRRRDAPDEATYEQQWRAAERRKNLMADLDEALERRCRDLDRSVRAGRLFAVARLAPNGPRHVLTNAERRKLKLFELPPPPGWSRAEPPYVADLGFYGLLELPDVASRLSGMRLVDAFREAVLNGPELRRVLDRSPLVGPVLDGRFTYGKRTWPVAIEDWCLADTWLVSQGYEREFRGGPYIIKNISHALDAEAHDTLIAIGRYVNARVARFLELLRTGALVARDGAATVPTWWWQSPSFRVDFQKGRLFEQVGEDSIERSSEPILTAGAAQFMPSLHRLAAPNSSAPAEMEEMNERQLHVKPITPNETQSRAMEDGANPYTGKRAQRDIHEAVCALWPSGAPKAKSAKDRNQSIIIWLAKNRNTKVNERSIYRYFEGTRKRL